MGVWSTVKTAMKIGGAIKSFLPSMGSDSAQNNVAPTKNRREDEETLLTTFEEQEPSSSPVVVSDENMKDIKNLSEEEKKFLEFAKDIKVDSNLWDTGDLLDIYKAYKDKDDDSIGVFLAGSEDDYTNKLVALQRAARAINGNKGNDFILFDKNNKNTSDIYKALDGLGVNNLKMVDDPKFFDIMKSPKKRKVNENAKYVAYKTKEVIGDEGWKARNKYHNSSEKDDLDAYYAKKEADPEYAFFGGEEGVDAKGFRDNIEYLRNALKDINDGKWGKGKRVDEAKSNYEKGIKEGSDSYTKYLAKMKKEHKDLFDAYSKAVDDEFIKNTNLDEVEYEPTPKETPKIEAPKEEPKIEEPKIEEPKEEKKEVAIKSLDLGKAFNSYKEKDAYKEKDEDKIDYDEPKMSSRFKGQDFVDAEVVEPGKESETQAMDKDDPTPTKDTIQEDHEEAVKSFDKMKDDTPDPDPTDGHSVKETTNTIKAPSMKAGPNQVGSIATETRFNDNPSKSSVLVSDERMKKLFGEDDISALSKIHSYDFTYKPEAQENLGLDGDEHSGVIAQEIADNPHYKGCVTELDNGTLALKTKELSAANTGAIGDLARAMEKLMSDVEEIKNRIGDK